MSKAFQLATMPELASDAISGRNMIINGSFQRCYRQRRNSPDIISGGNNYITDRWKVNAYATDSVNFVAQADSSSGVDGLAYNISEDGQQYAYLGYKTASVVPAKHYLVLFQTIEQTLVSQLKWGLGSQAKPAVLSFRAMFIPGQNDTRATHRISVAIRGVSEGTPGTQDLKQRSIVFDCTLTKVADRYEIRIPPLLDGGYDIASQAARGALDVMFTVSSKSADVVDVVPSDQIGQWVHSGRFISPNAESLGEASRVGSKVLISDVQFESGEVASRYDYEEFTNSLFLRCARYYYRVTSRTLLRGIPYNGKIFWWDNRYHPTPMRATPVITITIDGANEASIPASALAPSIVDTVKYTMNAWSTNSTLGVPAVEYLITADADL